MNYGREMNESTEKNNIEFSKIAADGKSYGIIRECSKYYIKVADADKATLAEAYDYIGGWNNKKDYEYTSYANALKNFDLKMMSINEARGVEGNAVSLDPSKKEDYIIEGTDQMKKELARQRQIMRNAARIGLYEAETHMTEDPERVSGNNDEDKPYTEKAEMKLDGGKDMPKASGKPESKGEPFDEKAPKINEDCEGGSCDKKDWGSEGLGKGNGDAASVKWVDGSKEVNEEINGAEDWNAGLPSSAGIGSPAETKKHVMDEGEDEYEVEGEEDAEAPVEDEPVEEPAEGGEESADDFDFSGEGEAESADDEPLDEPLEGGEEGEEDSDLEARIEDLEAEIEAIKSELYGDEEGAEDELSGEDEIGADELGGEDELSDEDELGSEESLDTDLGDEEAIDLDEPEEGSEEDFSDDEKELYMESIVNRVVNKILNEEKTVLHDFGKHPGYRKKVMSLPPTGSDNEKGMKDWNDDSVHSEEPFGKSIGDGAPYNQIVKMITDSVIEGLKKKD